MDTFPWAGDREQEVRSLLLFGYRSSTSKTDLHLLISSVPLPRVCQSYHFPLLKFLTVADQLFCSDDFLSFSLSKRFNNELERTRLQSSPFGFLPLSALVTAS